jgi:hypothetical protein
MSVLTHVRAQALAVEALSRVEREALEAASYNAHRSAYTTAHTFLGRVPGWVEKRARAEAAAAEAATHATAEAHALTTIRGDGYRAQRCMRTRIAAVHSFMLGHFIAWWRAVLAVAQVCDAEVQRVQPYAGERGPGCAGGAPGGRVHRHVQVRSRLRRRRRAMTTHADRVMWGLLTVRARAGGACG